MILKKMFNKAIMRTAVLWTVNGKKEFYQGQQWEDFVEKEVGKIGEVPQPSRI